MQYLPILYVDYKRDDIKNKGHRVGFVEGWDNDSYGVWKMASGSLENL